MAKLLHTMRMRLARLIAPAAAGGGRRLYAGARATRLTAGFGSGGASSADAELSSSLTLLRARSRQMVRDSAYAKRAKRIVVDNVIGTGMGMQCQVINTRGALHQQANDAIETAWAEWCEAPNCHTGGTLHFHDLERAAMGQVFEAGEVLLRKHYRALGGSAVPFALELIEPERLAADHADSVGVAPGNALRMGVEVDAYGRPVAYWLRSTHPGDITRHLHQVDRWERVPADDVYHLRVVDRWPQTRGEPWLHTVLRKLDDMNEYTGLEVQAARGSAAYFATIETPQPEAFPTDVEADGAGVVDLEPLTVQHLEPGEKLNFHTPNRPNVALDPFMRAMLREVAAGCGTSYESLSRDYSQSNYSSSRLALLDDRDGWRALQQWWIRAFRAPLHRAWMRQAVLARAITAVPVESYALDPRRWEAVHFKPRGWTWIDPTKEVNAYKEAIKAGLTTLTDVIAATGGGMDIEDVVRTRRRELDLLDEADIEVDTTVPDPAPAAAPAPAADPKADPAQPADQQADDGEGDTTDAASRRVIPIARATA